MDKKFGRIIMISEHADPLSQPGAKETGGLQVYVFHLAKELSKMGWSVDVFTRWDKRSKKPIVRFAKRARVIRIHAGPKRYIPHDNLAQYLPSFANGITAFQEKNKLRYDLIHCHYWLSGWSGLKLQELWNIPLVTTYHSLGHIKYHTLRKYHQKMSSENTFRIELEKTLAVKSAVLSTSPFEQDDLIKFYDANAANITVIPAGIDLKMFRHVSRGTARKKIGLPTEATVIFYAGRIEWRKGIATLIYALPVLLQKRPELKKTLILLIAGRISSEVERDEVKRLKEIASNLGVSKYVRFIGSKHRTVLKYYYSAANVCAVPSYYEPFGLVPLEAFACYCPVVASKIGGLQFTVHHDQTGLLVPPRNPRALAKALDTVMADQDRFITSVKQFARHELPNQFSWEAITKEMALYYARLLDAAKGKHRS